MKGTSHTVKPGPPKDTVQVECTLELASIKGGSAGLGFDLAKPQQSLPGIATFGRQVLERVADSIDMVMDGRTANVDDGVLASLNDLGSVFDRKKVTSVKMIVTGMRGRPGRNVLFDKSVRQRIRDHLRPPENCPIEIDGKVDIGDFSDNKKCRIVPVFGPAIYCAFEPTQEDDIYSVLRQTARIRGQAVKNKQTGKLEIVKIDSVTPLPSLQMGADNFMAGHSIEKLAEMQHVQPLSDVRALAGGWPDDEEPDEMLADIYAHRQ